MIDGQADLIMPPHPTSPTPLSSQPNITIFVRCLDNILYWILPYFQTTILDICGILFPLYLEVRTAVSDVTVCFKYVYYSDNAIRKYS